MVCHICCLRPRVLVWSQADTRWTGHIHYWKRHDSKYDFGETSGNNLRSHYKSLKIIEVFDIIIISIDQQAAGWQG